jgi:hypothetical protein
MPGPVLTRGPVPGASSGERFYTAEQMARRAAAWDSTAGRRRAHVTYWDGTLWWCLRAGCLWNTSSYSRHADGAAEYHQARDETLEEALEHERRAKGAA